MAFDAEGEGRRQDALDHAFRYLGFRDRTVVEMRRHLERKGHEQAVVEAAIAELGRMDYLDDARYARRFTEDRRRLDAWGAQRIERRLIAAGIDPEVAAGALDGGDEQSELEAALALLRKHRPGPPADDRARERALALLVRKGYALEVAYDAVRALGRAA